MRFEWRSTLERMNVNALYLLDDERSWWHFCMDEAMELFRRYNPDMLIGSSMGGYGALLFGGLLDKPARAFGPQTALVKSTWDTRWEDCLERVREKTKYPERLNLSVAGDQFHVHYCRNNEEDRQHAERLSVRLIAHDCSVHPPQILDHTEMLV